MRKLLVLLFISITTSVSAQIIGPINEQYDAIRQNGVSSMAAFGDTVWISPELNRNINNNAEWYTPENADSVTGEGIGRVYSLALGQDTVVAGLGYTKETISGPTQTAYGYYISIDGGMDWRFTPYPIDPDPPSKCDPTSENYVEPKGPEDYDPDCDIQFQYGDKVYSRIRYTVAEQAPPFEIDFHDDVIFSANFAGGLLRSINSGRDWERVILPPDNVGSLVPENEYSWSSSFGFYNEDINDSDTTTINRYDPRSVASENLRVFAVEIDSEKNVWVGTANGINISNNALSAPSDSISWTHINYDRSEDGLIGDWIITVRQEPGTNRIWMTNWRVASPQNEGIVYTDDGGETFKQMLIGERINDIGFKDGYVFAAGDDGLFVSADTGDTWVQLPRLQSPNTFIKSSAFYYSVASTTDRVWIGTSDGIGSIECCSQNQSFDNWQITRVNYPLKGGNVHEPEGRNTNAYAYPNPFSASVYDLVRIKFEVKKQGNVRVRVFDFGMNLVREVENDSFAPGTYEAVWDGYDGQGRKVANGPYIYVIETAGKEFSGKILVVD